LAVIACLCLEVAVPAMKGLCKARSAKVFFPWSPMLDDVNGMFGGARPPTVHGSGRLGRVKVKVKVDTWIVSGDDRATKMAGDAV
jgi:hypothetical protein